MTANDRKGTLSLIVPVYNEGTAVYQVLDRYYKYLHKTFSEFEIIVAVDGDDEKTFDAVESFMNDHNDVKMSFSSRRRGKGGAVIDCFSMVRYRFAAIADADTSITPYAITKLIDAIRDGDAEVAIGSRYVRGAKITVPLRRMILSRFFNVLVRLVTGLSISDTQCGSKVISSKHLPELIKYQREYGWAFDVQMLYILNKLNARIVEVPVSWVFAEGSKMNLLSDIPQMFISTLRARRIATKNGNE